MVTVFRISDRAALEAEEAVVEEIVVTGSYLRGAQGASPVRTITSDEIGRRGHATVAEALAALPQNFGGTANEATAATSADRSSSNSGYASGVNLRGLGADATLVLVNGRRMAGTGIAGDFSDVSTLPSSAVERVEVLLDGASALYGSDAVGGVVNVILRDRFDGAESRLRIGLNTDGASQSYQASHTAGRNWSTGSLIGSYEFQERTRLRASDRRYAGDADLRDLGGSDRRLFFASPGNILGYDPVADAFVPTHAIPDGQDGTDLEPGDLLAGVVNLTNQQEGLDVLPRQTRHSVFAALTQQIGAAFTLKADVRYGLREFERKSFADIGSFIVTSANPFFVSPDGSTESDLVYSFIDDLGPSTGEGSVRSLAASAGFDGDIGRWRITGYIAGAEERLETLNANLVNTTYLAEALGAVPDSPLTDFRTSRDGFFNPYGDGGDNSREVLDFIGSGFGSTRGRTQVLSANLKIDGTLFDLPAGAVRLALGADHRREVFERQTTNFFFGTTPTTSIVPDSERTITAAFAELLVPVVGAANAVPGIRRLDLSLAGRVEVFEDIGSTADPKIGLIWSPATDVVVRASYGESFRAPSLIELNSGETILPTTLDRSGTPVISLLQYGGNPDLEPETAKSTTVGLTWSPRALDGLSLNLNWFRIRFADRIGLPVIENIEAALNDPAYAPFVTLVSPATNPTDLVRLQALLARPGALRPTAVPVTRYGAIIDARYANAEETVVEGVDITARYETTLGGGRIGFDLEASKLSAFDRQLTPDGPFQPLLGRPSYPMAWRVRLGGRWSRGPWSAGMAADYVDDGFDAVSDRPIASWTTFDGQVRYDFGASRGLSVALDIQNILDTDPPFYDSLDGLGYDPANSDVTGRYASIQLIKRW